MSLLKNGAFCVLPFIHDHQDTNLTQRLCCHSKTPIDSIDSTDTDLLRQKILLGEKIPHCNSCYQQEQNARISPRLRESSRWLRDPEIKTYIDSWVPGHLETFFYDIRVENKCNLACIGCGPAQSTLWARELGIKSSKVSPNYNTQKMLRSKKIYLAGGEPLIINKFIELLELISKQTVQPEVVINTNLTRVNPRLVEILTQIKNLTLTISVDAFDKVNEYHRWPLKWDKFLKNLECVNKIGCTIQFNTVIDAVTVINVDQLIQIEHLTHMWNLVNLRSPQALRVNNLPELLKKDIVSNFEKIKLSRFYSSDLSFRRQVDSILSDIVEPGNPELLSMYIDQIDQRRKINHQTYLGIKLT
jgi:sulfatase maturation enzyme AslB (radical SAM superfamily)